jgi:iron complex transport system substrate-binding protein
MNHHAARRDRLRYPLLSTLLTGAAIAAALAALTAPGAHAERAAVNPASKASNGVALPATATRIVSLSGAATQDLFADGAGKQVVAVDQYSTYPSNAPRTKLSGFSPNVEAIAKYKPDLVVISNNVDDLEQHLASLHIPVLLEAAPTNFSGIYAQLTGLGDATGHAKQAASVVARMKRQVAAAVASVKREHPPLSVYDELDQTFYSTSSKTFVGQVFTMLGLKNIADAAAKEAAYPQLSSEYIVGSDPDLIVLSDTVCCGQSYKTVAARPGWSSIAAVQHHDVVGVNDTIASQWGPLFVTFVEDVAAAVRKIEAQTKT